MKTVSIVIEADPMLQLRVFITTLKMLEDATGFPVPPEEICDITFGKPPK